MRNERRRVDEKKISREQSSETMDEIEKVARKRPHIDHPTVKMATGTRDGEEIINMEVTITKNPEGKKSVERVAIPADVRDKLPRRTQAIISALETGHLSYEEEDPKEGTSTNIEFRRVVELDGRSL